MCYSRHAIYKSENRDNVIKDAKIELKVEERSIICVGLYNV